MRMKLPDQPHDLSYYTTWWLTSESSMSPQNTTFSASDDNICIDEHEEKQVNFRKDIFKKETMFFVFHLENDNERNDI
ncbi:unnamed protein product [Rotaria sp. Silwood1]|nr:unnamed protein product [Rotaria sp. Silwood1]